MQITLCQVPDRYDWLGKVALKVISAEADIGRAGTNPRPHELQGRKIIDPCCSGVEKEVQLLVGRLFRAVRNRNTSLNQTLN